MARHAGPRFKLNLMLPLPPLRVPSPSRKAGAKSPAYTPVRGLRKGLVAAGTVNLTPLADEGREDQRGARVEAALEKENILPRIAAQSGDAAGAAGCAETASTRERGLRKPRGRARSSKVHPAASCDAPDVIAAAPPCPPRPLERMLVVLDMDDTLIHTTFMDSPMASRPPRRGTETFPIVLDDGERATVARRPGLHKFLTLASELFDLVLFTAAEYDYAVEVLNAIDPGARFIPESRRFYRRDCLKSGTRYIKDLRVVLARCYPDRAFDFSNTNAPIDHCDALLKRVVLVDDNPWSFAAQPHNGVPVKKFSDDPMDTELVKLLRFLSNASQLDDVQPYLEERFRIEESLDRHRAMVSGQ